MSEDFSLASGRAQLRISLARKALPRVNTSFSTKPSEKFIIGEYEAWNEGRLVNKSISLLFYDTTAEKFRRKSFYSYGFVNNEVEYARDSKEIEFDVTMKPLPKEFEGIQWRFSIRKISEKKVAMGLKMARGREEFRRFGETVLVKTGYTLR